MFNVANNTSFGNDEWIGYHLNWSGTGLQPSAWQKWQSPTVTVDSTLHRIGTRAGALDRNIYFHSVAAYVNNPTNALWLLDKDNNRTFITVPNETFVFPSSIASIPVKYWTEGSNIYAPGSTSARSTVCGKTFRPVLYKTVTFSSSGSNSGKSVLAALENIDSTALSTGTVLAALYDNDDRLLGVKALDNDTATAACDDGVMIYAGDLNTAVTAKLFCCDRTSLKPLCKSVSAILA